MLWPLDWTFSRYLNKPLYLGTRNRSDAFPEFAKPLSLFLIFKLVFLFLFKSIFAYTPTITICLWDNYYFPFKTPKFFFLSFLSLTSFYLCYLKPGILWAFFFANLPSVAMKKLGSLFLTAPAFPVWVILEEKCQTMRSWSPKV